jgi:cytochrome c peroxidase
VNSLKPFTDGTVSVENMLKALSQFMVMLTSSNSKFDHYRRNEVEVPTVMKQLVMPFNTKCALSLDLMTDDALETTDLA